MRGKRGIEFSFGWMFAIIVGGVIIFLAIYGTTKLVGTERTITEAEVSKQLGILLNPVETSIEEGKISKISFIDETRLYNDCRDGGTFGLQLLSTATKSGIGEKWARPGNPATFLNKYIFSEDIIQGEGLVIFAKPFNFPFKVADVLFIWSDKDKYCFVSPPISVEEELESLNPKNVNVTLVEEDCDEEDIKVCFSTSGCEIDVSLGSRSVTKDGKTVYYDNSFGSTLLYGAIFSGSELYECQIKRLMKRTSELASVYKDKAISLSGRGCITGLVSELESFADITKQIGDSSDLSSLSFIAEDLERGNDAALCKIF